MRAMQSLSRRIKSLFAKDSSNAELSEELQFHMEREIEQNVADGMSLEDAKAAARASFGSVPEITEDCYRARGTAWIEDFEQDVRYGLRTMLKHRSFSVVTVLTLALGIGACTAVFSLMDAVLLRSLPYGDVEGLVYLFTPVPQWSLPREALGPSTADFFDLKRESRSYISMTLFEQASYNLAAKEHPERIDGVKVDGDFFATLQSTAELGRTIQEADQQPGSSHVAVISDALRRNLFGGRSDILGRIVRLDGAPYQIVGVMPPEFGFPHKVDLSYGNGHTNTTQIWVPYGLTPQQKANRDSFLGYTVARLKPGVTAAEAQAEMSAIIARLNGLHQVNTRGMEAYVKPFRENVVGPVRPLMWLLLLAVGLVLLIACGNAANLFLARAANRMHEFSVRATLGARRWRLLRQMLTESLMLSVAAGAIGVGLAYVFLHGLLRLDPGDIPRMQDARLDVRVLLFTVGVTVLTSTLFGVLPALAATRVDLARILTSSGMRGIIGDRRHVRDGLVIAQIALVVVLLTGAGLLLRSYVNLMAVPTGFSPSTVSVNVQFTSQYDNGSQKSLTFFRELTERMKSVPGIEAAGVIHVLPLTNTESLTRFDVDGYENKKNQLAESRAITDGYLSAMQITLLEGRSFTGSEAMESSQTVLVNEAFARRYFDGESAIGRHIRIPAESENSWATVIGVVSNIRNMDLEATAMPQIYIPLSWYSNLTEGYLVVRSTLPEDSVVADIRNVIKGIDPNLAIADVRTMGDLVSQATARRKFQTLLLTVFSGIAMLLAVIGVYGLLAFSVRRRTGEIGIRMALGSTRMKVAGLVLREGLVLLATGLVIGLAAALAFTRLLSKFLFEVPPIDPMTYAVVPLLLLVGTVAASLIPSLRAAYIDPMNALRHE